MISNEKLDMAIDYLTYIPAKTALLEYRELRRLCEPLRGFAPGFIYNLSLEQKHFLANIVNKVQEFFGPLAPTIEDQLKAFKDAVMDILPKRGMFVQVEDPAMESSPVALRITISQLRKLLEMVK